MVKKSSKKTAEKTAKNAGKKESKKEEPKLTDKERVDKGQMLARIIIEILGAPKDYVEEAAQLVVDRIAKTDKIELVSESTYEAEPKGKLFSTFSEVEVWFETLDELSKFIFDFTPSSVEIIQPSEKLFKARFLSGFFNDFLLKMHDLGLKLKDEVAKSHLAEKNADVLVRNFLHFVLEAPRSGEDVAKIMGIPPDNVDAILGTFEKAGIIENTAGLYSLKKK
ncbi:MAG: hypothetical protein V1729_02780 [Candidatus Woesearchaeota archaeon]